MLFPQKSKENSTQGDKIWSSLDAGQGKGEESRFSTNTIHRSEQTYCLLRRCGGSAVSVPIRSSCSFLPACFIDSVILSHTCLKIPNKITHIWIQMNKTAWGRTREIADNVLPTQNSQWVLCVQRRVICWFSFVDLKLFDSITRRPTALTKQWEQRRHISFISYWPMKSLKGWAPYCGNSSPEL